jgi:hypothetical protein
VNASLIVNHPVIPIGVDLYVVNALAETSTISERIEEIRVKQSKLIPQEFSPLLYPGIMCIDAAGLAPSATKAEPTGARRANTLDFALAHREQLAAAARRFADKYRDYSSHQQIDKVVDRLDCTLQPRVG